MVFKIIALLAMTPWSHASPAPLTLKWTGSKTPACRQLIESFLLELRSMASDRAIELELENTTDERESNSIRIECAANLDGIEAADADGRLFLRYQKKAQGFDAIDWLPFQKRFLSAEVKLATWDANQVPPAEAAPAISAVEKTSNESETLTVRPNPLYERWWFWALVGGVGAGVYGALKLSEDDSGSKNVIIH